MRVADLTSGTAKLIESLKTLRIRWEATKEDWNDPVSREFEEHYLSIFEPQVQVTLERLRRLAQVLATAEHECRDDRGDAG
jgi:hypothetical protein